MSNVQVAKNLSKAHYGPASIDLLQFVFTSLESEVSNISVDIVLICSKFWGKALFFVAEKGCRCQANSFLLIPHVCFEPFFKMPINNSFANFSRLKAFMPILDAQRVF